MELKAAVTKRGRLFRGQSKELVDKEARKQLKAAAEFLARGIRAAAPAATGTLRDSIKTQYLDNASRVFSEESYAIPVEAGRAAATIPIAPLVLWFEKRLGLSGDEAVEAAIRTARSRPAIAANPFFYRTFDRLAPVLASQFLVPIAATIVRELDQT